MAIVKGPLEHQIEAAARLLADKAWRTNYDGLLPGWLDQEKFPMYIGTKFQGHQEDVKDMVRELWKTLTGYVDPYGAMTVHTVRAFSGRIPNRVEDPDVEPVLAQGINTGNGTLMLQTVTPGVVDYLRGYDWKGNIMFQMQMHHPFPTGAIGSSQDVWPRMQINLSLA